MTDIALLNHSTHIADADLEAAIVAFNTQISRDFEPAWGLGATVWNETSAPANAWKFYLQDGLDQAGDLGYHDDNGVPEAKIDIQGSLAAGASWQSVVSHELLEAIADPLCNRMAPDGVTIVEVCDPVEESFYLIDDVPVSSFVLPAYFGFDTTTKYDYRGELTAPAPSMLAGGYIMQYLSGQWVSHFGRMADGSLSWMALRASGRSTFRAGQGAPGT